MIGRAFLLRLIMENQAKHDALLVVVGELVDTLASGTMLLCEFISAVKKLDDAPIVGAIDRPTGLRM
jgi:UDP-2,3-diacylglucosamine pyrophosphatase LpxH